MVVTGTNGDGLRCRTAPNGSVITVMSEGTRVSVRGATENGWVRITCASQNGYASAQFLGSASSGDTGTPPPSTGTPSSGTVTVSGTGGSRLNCRTSPNGSVITPSPKARSSRSVAPPRMAGCPWSAAAATVGFSSMYVTAGGDPGSAPGGDTGDPGSKPDASTGTATVVNTDGDSLRCRATPGGTTITMLAPGSTVSLRAEKSGDWQGVSAPGRMVSRAAPT